MNIKINFRNGIRRIVLSLIGLGVIIALISFCFYGGIWNQYRFIENTKVYQIDTPEVRLNLYDFIKEYNNKNVWYSDIACFPYKSYCEYNHQKYKNNEKFVIGKEYKEIDLSLISRLPNEELNDFYKLLALLDEKFNKMVDSGKIIIGDVNGRETIEINLMFKCPSKIQYFLWQLWDFLLIFIIAGFAYLVYLILEHTFCWIISGFKKEE